MASAKSGSAGSAVAPADPAEAKEADVADPGEAQEVKARKRTPDQGEYASVKCKPHKPDNKKLSWVEIEMVDEEGDPVPGEPFRIVLPGGDRVAEGTLDQRGFAKIGGVEPGNCKISFPALDAEAWEPA